MNAAAVATGKPLISAAITQWEGQISLYDPARGAPCYACIFPERPAAGLVPTCAEAGVVGALPGVLGAMMALEAVKQITGAGRDAARTAADLSTGFMARAGRSSLKRARRLRGLRRDLRRAAAG